MTPLTQEHRPSGLPRRKSQLPGRYRDFLPPPSPTINPPDDSEPLGGPEDDIQPNTTSSVSTYTSPTNSFGIYRVYTCGAPSYTPDDDFSLEDVADNPNFTRPSSASRPVSSSIPFVISPSTHMSVGDTLNPASIQHSQNPLVL